MKTVTVAESPTVPNPHGLDAHRLHSSPEVEVVHVHLPAGHALARHAAPVDTLFYVVTGTATIESDSGSATAPAGSLIPHPKETFHRVRNETGGGSSSSSSRPRGPLRRPASMNQTINPNQQGVNL